MKKITLKSHYNGIELNLRVSEDTYNVLLLHGDPMELICDDIVRVRYAEEPKLLSNYQCRKVDTFFAKDSCEYFDRVLFY